MNAKRYVLVLTGAMALALASVACDTSDAQQVQAEPEVGFDLKALGNLMNNGIADAQTLEQKINDPSSGVNNLDLNKDGSVDYLTVSEWSNQYGKGFKITDGSVNPAQQVASIDAKQPSPGNVSVTIVGDPNIYGQNYSMSFDQRLADAMLFNYLFMPHPVYMSPYHYGYYPSYYRPYVPVPYRQYRSRVDQQVTTTKTTIRRNPAPQSASSPRPSAPRSLSNGSTQKQFAPRETSRPVSSGGFGRTPSASPSSSPSRSYSRPASRPSAPRRR